MPVLVKNLVVVSDPWTLVDSQDAADTVPGERQILPFDSWTGRAHSTDGAHVRFPGAGFWVDGDVDAELVREHLAGASLVAVKFPAFVDGRGLSLGVMLRSRYGFTGELRAFGDILPDLAQYLHRSGFDAFVVANRRAAEVAITSIGSITDHYQASVLQTQPAFRRIQAAN